MKDPAKSPKIIRIFFVDEAALPTDVRAQPKLAIKYLHSGK